MNRRGFCTLLATMGMGGCVGQLSGADTDTAVGTTRAYLSAVGNGNIDRVDDLTVRDYSDHGNTLLEGAVSIKTIEERSIRQWLTHGPTDVDNETVAEYVNQRKSKIEAIEDSGDYTDSAIVFVDGQIGSQSLLIYLVLVEDSEWLLYTDLRHPSDLEPTTNA